MNVYTPRQLAEQLWGRFDALDFEAVAELLHDDFVCDWPQSQERIRGREHFIAINRNYPGKWRIHLVNLVEAGDVVVTEIKTEFEGRSDTAISFFTIREGRIVHIREYWPEPFAAPEWRTQWVERM